MGEAIVEEAAHDIGMFLLAEGLQGKVVVLGDDSYCTLTSDGELMQNNTKSIPYEKALEEAVDSIICDPEVNTIILRSRKVSNHLKATGTIQLTEKNKGSYTYTREDRTYDLR